MCGNPYLQTMMRAVIDGQLRQRHRQRSEQMNEEVLQEIDVVNSRMLSV